MWVSHRRVLPASGATVEDEGPALDVYSPYVSGQDFHIIPVPNPDGYVYTWEHDRFWYASSAPCSPML